MVKQKGEGVTLNLGKVQINLTNRWLYTFIALGILAIIGVGVYAYGTSDPPTFGHSADEIEFDWNDLVATNTVPAGFADGNDADTILTDTKCDTSGTCSQVCIGTNCQTSWPGGGSLSCNTYNCNPHGSAQCIAWCPIGTIATGGGTQGDHADGFPYIQTPYQGWKCYDSTACYVRCCKIT